MIKLCKCGCGEEVKSKRKTTCFISGHQSRIQSLETRLKRSNSMKGKIRSESHSRHISEALTGRISPIKGRKGLFHHSEKFKQEMSERQVGEKNHMFGKHMSMKTKKKLSMVMTGRVLSEDHKLKIALGNTGKVHSLEHIQKCKRFGPDHWLYGKEHSEEVKAKIKATIIKTWSRPEIKNKVSGKNNHNWKGGTSREPYSQDWTNDLKKVIRKRDNYTCRLCSISQKN